MASNVPDSAYQATTGTALRDQLASAAIMTDGAARLVERFHIATWPATFDLLDQHGPSALTTQVREAEHWDPHGHQWPRGKDHDDATIALCRIRL